MMIIALASLILIAQSDPASDPAANLEALQQLYAESCGSRGYAAYDDVCDQIGEQIRQAEKSVGRTLRGAMEPAAAKPAPAESSPPQQPAIPTASADTGTTPKTQ